MSLAARVFFLFLSAVIPLKFSSILLPEATGMWQDNIIGWIINPWPYGFFFIMAACSLLLNWMAFAGRQYRLSRYQFIFLGLFSLLLIISAAGIVGASQKATGILMLQYIFALLIYLWALKLFLCADSVSRNYVIYAWGTGIVLTMICALYQYLWGFDALEEYIKQSGQNISGVILAKIADRRTSSPYDLANSLAGAIMLGTPLLIVAAAQAARYFSPENLSRRIFITVVLAAGLFILATTRSRAAILALLIAAAITVVLKINNAKLKMAALFVIVLLAAGGGLYTTYSQRGLGSMRVRFDYAATAAKMAITHPFAGSGWGEFQFDYMQDKNDGTEEAPRDPHNMILSFASQCGIPAGVVCLILMLLPFYGCWRQGGFKCRNNQIMAFGLLAFSVHALVEIHLLIPSLMAMWLTVGMIMLTPAEPSNAPVYSKRNPVLLIAAIIGLLVFCYGIVCDYYFYLVASSGTPDRAMRRNFAILDRLQPYSPYHHLIIARRMTTFNPEEATLLAGIAAKRSPRDPEPYIILMENAISSNDNEAAQNALIEARKRFPHNWLLEGSPRQALEQIKKSRL